MNSIINELAHEVLDELEKDQVKPAPPGTAYPGEGVAYPGDGAAWPGDNIINPEWG